MATKEKILKIIGKHGITSSSQLVKELKISRQTTAFHLKELVAAGRLIREGSTRAAKYFLPTQAHQPKPQLRSISLIKKIKGLEEDKVFAELDLKLGIKGAVNTNVYHILSYAFTEMLNNSIDHSQSLKVKISAVLQPLSFEFHIRDYGIGVYKNVKDKFKLQNEIEAIEHVFKGKQTTVPHAHSGEGIFFTSKISDRFVLRSHKLRTTVDNVIRDSFVSDERNLIGTEVAFNLLRFSKKKLQPLFDEYSNQDFEFDKSVLKVRLSTFGGSLSRSQAKRLMYGLEKYKRIILDLKGVKEIGQAFADEVFRVFLKNHPGIEVGYINASSAVKFMIERALSSRSP